MRVDIDRAAKAMAACSHYRFAASNCLGRRRTLTNREAPRLCLTA